MPSRATRKKNDIPPHRKDAAAAERARQALELRLQGFTYEEIAHVCGYAGRQGSYKAVQRELQRTIQEPAEEVRIMEVSRLDRLYRVMESKALKGDTWSVDRCLKIMERRAALLGLDTRPEQSSLAGNYTKRIILEEGPAVVLPPPSPQRMEIHP